MLKLPIGTSNFKKIIDNQQRIVDKSLFIEEVISDSAEVILITRPRRFGKTLNLSMLQYFFSNEVEGEKTAGLFDGFNISKNESCCAKYQGKYPVIFLTFKDIKRSIITECYASIAEAIQEAYTEHEYLLQSPGMHDKAKVIYQQIIDECASIMDLSMALKRLIKYLYFHHRQKVIVLIDEYDTPIQSGYINGYYEEIALFFHHFFGSALKDNNFLFKCVLTGILRVSKESLFSGLNNVSTYSVLNPQYAAYFGFTEKEVSELLEAAHWTENAAEVKAWYNGYQIGDVVLYNPWSIVNCIRHRIFEPYWINTSDNVLIHDILLKSDIALKGQLELLIQDQSVTRAIDEYFVYADLQKNGESAIWSFLLMTGYLKIVSAERTAQQGRMCVLAIPNKEVSDLYKKMIQQWLFHGREEGWYTGFMENLLQGDMTRFSEGLRDIMEQIVSFHDVAAKPEAFYHGLMLGLTSSLHQHPDYEIQSNRESGEGRYDYCIISKDPAKLSIIFEFKRVDITDKDKKKSDRVIAEKLQHAAETALAQIDNRHYLSELKRRRLSNILTIGIAFSGRRLGIVYKRHVE